jgi:hypothetical protein
MKRFLPCSIRYALQFIVGLEMLWFSRLHFLVLEYYVGNVFRLREAYYSIGRHETAVMVAHLLGYQFLAYAVIWVATRIVNRGGAMQNSKTEKMAAQIAAGKKPTGTPAGGVPARQAVEGVPDKSENWRDTLHEVIAEDAEEDWVSFNPAK